MYKVGQRIELTVDHPDNNHYLLTGDCGTIKSVYHTQDGREKLAVEWDKRCRGHECGGLCERPQHGWYVYSYNVIPEDAAEMEADPSELNGFLAGLIISPAI